jgi:hypothetical protein
LLHRVRAESSDAHHALDRLAVAHGYEKVLVPPSPWVRELLDGVLGPNVRTARLCSHLRAGSSPAIVFLTAHRRRVECTRCSQRAARATAGTPEDHTCDRCRALISADLIEVVTWAVGPIVVTAGHCVGCREAVRGPGVVSA